MAKSNSLAGKILKCINITRFHNCTKNKNLRNWLYLEAATTSNIFKRELKQLLKEDVIFRTYRKLPSQFLQTRELSYINSYQIHQLKYSWTKLFHNRIFTDIAIIYLFTCTNSRDKAQFLKFEAFLRPNQLMPVISNKNSLI